MAQSDVSSLLPTVTRYTLPPDPIGLTLYELALSRITLDLPENIATLAQCYLVADMLSHGDRTYNVNSQSLGDYSYSSGTTKSGKSNWYQAYLDLIESYENGAIWDTCAVGVSLKDCLPVGLVDCGRQHYDNE